MVKSSFLDSLPKGLLSRSVKAGAAEERAIAVQAIGHRLKFADITPEERNLVDCLLARICDDVSDLVRRALAVTLRASNNLPKDVARRLIEDIDSIAIPVIEHSPVLSDDDLMDILRSRAAAKIRAIANRREISLRISSVLISHSDRVTVAALAANDGAVISSDAASEMARIYADDDLIRDAALSRQDMPPAVIQKLINASTRDVQTKLEPEIGADTAQDLAQALQERVTLNYKAGDWSESALKAYVETLFENGELTASLICRAAGRGDFRFIQLSLALLARVNPDKAALMLFSSGHFAVVALCRRAGFAVKEATFLAAAVKIFLDLRDRGRALNRPKFQSLLLERLLTQDTDLPEGLEDLFCNWLDEIPQLRAV